MSSTQKIKILKSADMVYNGNREILSKNIKTNVKFMSLSPFSLENFYRNSLGIDKSVENDFSYFMST